MKEKQVNAMTQETKGMWLGAIGVAIFSLTLPFTRMAVAELNPVLVALGRAVVAAVGSALLLWWIDAPRPAGRQRWRWVRRRGPRCC